MKNQTKKKQPTADEIAQADKKRQARNRDLLCKGHTLAKEAFRTESPTIEMAIGCSQLLESEVEDISSVIQVAAKMAARYDLKTPGDVLDFVGIVLYDLDGEDVERIAKEAFSTQTPSLEMVFGVEELLDADVPSDIIPAIIAKSLRMGDAFGAADIEDVFAIAEILSSEDEDAELHLMEAADEARELLGKVTTEDAVVVYHQIYGVDEE